MFRTLIYTLIFFCFQTSSFAQDTIFAHTDEMQSFFKRNGIRFVSSYT